MSTSSTTSAIDRAERKAERAKKLRKLQSKIAPPVRLVDSDDTENLARITGRTKRSAAAFHAYLSTCLEDAQLAAVAHGYSLNERSLYKIYVRLIETGLNKWVRGEHIALSCIAKPETLLFVARARQRQATWIEISQQLDRFHRREILPQELLCKDVKSTRSTGS